MIKFVAKYSIEGIENSTIEECLSYLSTLEVVGIDTETSKHPKYGHLETEIYKGGLCPFLSRVLMLQIGDLHQQFVIDVRDFTKEELKPLIEFLHWNDKVIFVGQNLKFDGKHLRHNFGIRLKKVYDTMLAEISLYNGLNIPLSLAGLAKKYLGVTEVKQKTGNLFEESLDISEQITLDEELLKLDGYISPFEVANLLQINKSTRLQFINLKAQPFTYEQVAYGGDDIIYPLLIRDKQSLGHNLFGFHFYNGDNIRFESTYTQVGVDMEYVGLPFSKKIWQDLFEVNKIEYEQRLADLDKYVIDTYGTAEQLDLFEAKSHGIEWGSPKQVVNFFRKLNACPREKSKSTKQMEWSVSAKAMLPTLSNKLKDFYMKDKWQPITDVPSLKLAYLLVRKAKMNITTYGEEFLRYVHPITGRLHPSYRLHLLSARTATTSPNLLAIPGSHRIAFTTEGTDKVLITNDFSSQESRIIGAYSADISLTSFFNNGHPIFGDDFHSYTADLVEKIRNPKSTDKFFPKGHPEFTHDMDEKRQRTKATNFGLAYGITAISLSKTLGIDEEDAEQLMSDYFEALPQLKEFLNNSSADAQDKGYIIFEPKLQAVFLQAGFGAMKKKREKCMGYFFNDEYKAMNKTNRAIYKADLYAKNPQIKKDFTDIGVMTSRLGNRGCNLKIQGCAAKQSKLAQMKMRQHSIIHPELGWNICLLLHDEVVSESDILHAETVSKLQGKYMKDSAEYFCENVIFETSGKISKVWEH
jgi:DNA polymerase I-like protein with 3'-5' exonuclease and polymerase domains